MIDALDGRVARPFRPRRARRPGSERFRFALTPAGAGVFSLFFPGLLISAVARQRVLVAVCIGAGVLLLVNTILARRALARLELVTNAPSAPITVGADVELAVAVDGSVSPFLCGLAVEHGVEGWLAAMAPIAGPVTIRPAARAVLGHLDARLRTMAPLGLVSCIRHTAIVLEPPLHVAPAAVATPVADPRGIVAELDQGRGGDPIGVRPYAPGDPQRDLHWPSVARTGTLLVRDRRRTEMPSEVTVVPMFTSGAETDVVLGRARDAVDNLIRSGHPVRLVTTELTAASPDGGGDGDDEGGTVVVTRLVEGPDDLLRRLAAAVRPSGDAAPDGTPAGSGPRLLVGDEGVRWPAGG